MQFVEFRQYLTQGQQRIQGPPILVNVDRIKSVVPIPNSPAAMIETTDGAKIVTSEDYATVKEMLGGADSRG
jgi:hypothetical protein